VGELVSSRVLAGDLERRRIGVGREGLFCAEGQGGEREDPASSPDVQHGFDRLELRDALEAQRGRRMKPTPERSFGAELEDRFGAGGPPAGFLHPCSPEWDNREATDRERPGKKRRRRTLI